MAKNTAQAKPDDPAPRTSFHTLIWNMIVAEILELGADGKDLFPNSVVVGATGIADGALSSLLDIDNYRVYAAEGQDGNYNHDELRDFINDLHKVSAPNETLPIDMNPKTQFDNKKDKIDKNNPLPIANCFSIYVRVLHWTQNVQIEIYDYDQHKRWSGLFPSLYESKKRIEASQNIQHIEIKEAALIKDFSEKAKIGDQFKYCSVLHIDMMPWNENTRIRGYDKHNDLVDTTYSRNLYLGAHIIDRLAKRLTQKRSGAYTAKTQIMDTLIDFGSTPVTNIFDEPNILHRFLNTQVEGVTIEMVQWDGKPGKQELFKKYNNHHRHPTVPRSFQSFYENAKNAFSTEEEQTFRKNFNRFCELFLSKTTTILPWNSTTTLTKLFDEYNRDPRFSHYLKRFINEDLASGLIDLEPVPYASPKQKYKGYTPVPKLSDELLRSVLIKYLSTAGEDVSSEATNSLPATKNNTTSIDPIQLFNEYNRHPDFLYSLQRFINEDTAQAQIYPPVLNEYNTLLDPEDITTQLPIPISRNVFLHSTRSASPTDVDSAVFSDDSKLSSRCSSKTSEGLGLSDIEDELEEPDLGELFKAAANKPLIDMLQRFRHYSPLEATNAERLIKPLTFPHDTTCSEAVRFAVIKNVREVVGIFTIDEMSHLLRRNCKRALAEKLKQLDTNDKTKYTSHEILEKLVTSQLISPKEQGETLSSIQQIANKYNPLKHSKEEIAQAVNLLQLILSIQDLQFSKCMATSKLYERLYTIASSPFISSETVSGFLLVVAGSVLGSSLLSNYILDTNNLDFNSIASCFLWSVLSFGLYELTINTLGSIHYGAITGEKSFSLNQLSPTNLGKTFNRVKGYSEDLSRYIDFHKTDIATSFMLRNHWDDLPALMLMWKFSSLFYILAESCLPDNSKFQKFANFVDNQRLNVSAAQGTIHHTFSCLVTTATSITLDGAKNVASGVARICQKSIDKIRESGDTYVNRVSAATQTYQQTEPTYRSI